MSVSSFPSRSPFRGRRAFTIVELLVLLGILAILVSLLMPAISRARKQANTVACASNLAQVYRAISQWRTDVPDADAPWGGWRGAFTKYVGPTKDRLSHPVFGCPEADPAPGTSDYDYADLVVRVRRGGAEQWDVPLSPGARSRIADKSTLLGPKHTVGIEKQKLTENNDINFEDATLDVEFTGDNKARVSVASAAPAPAGATTTMALYDATNDREVYGIAGGQSVDVDNYATFALNTYMNEILGSADKIIALDYVTATITPGAARDNWSDNATKFLQGNKLKFARHSNRVNALFGDGHVDVTDIGLRNEYDFGDASNGETARVRYWAKE